MINKTVLAGRLTKDVELRKTGQGTSVAGFTLAVNRRFTREGEPEADFISCVAWKQSAEFLAQYAGKGVLLGVEGHLQTRSYDDQQGRKVYVTEVVCDNVCILAKPNTEQNQQRSQNNYNQQAGNNYGAPAQNNYGAYTGGNNAGGYSGRPQPQNAPQGVYNAPDYGYHNPFMNNPPLDISSDDLPF